MPPQPEAVRPTETTSMPQTAEPAQTASFEEALAELGRIVAGLE